MVTMRKIVAAFDLPSGWFDAPIGTALPKEVKATYGAPPAAGAKHVVSEQTPDERARLQAPADWPFTIVTYQRIKLLRQYYSQQGMPPALSEIDKHLDVLVTRWENEMTKQKSAAA